MPATTMQNIERYPAIRKAALNIAYDNGMVNRDMPEPEFLRRVDAVVGADGVNHKDLVAINSVLSAFSDEQLDTLCTGEEQEQGALMAGQPLKSKILGLLNDIFYC